MAIAVANSHHVNKKASIYNEFKRHLPALKFIDEDSSPLQWQLKRCD